MTCHIVSIGPARCPLYVYHLIHAAARARRVPICVPFGIVFAESGCNPWAHNVVPPDDSHGILQLNRNGGQGAGYSSAALCDPAISLLIGLWPIATAYREAHGRGLSGLPLLEAVCASSGHNRSDGRVTPAVRVIARKVWDCTFDASGALIRYPTPRFRPFT